GLLGRGEAGVLADRPGLRGVHRRVRPTQVRGDAGVRAQEVHIGQIGRGVALLDGDALRGVPRYVRQRRLHNGRATELDAGEVGNQRGAPSWSSAVVRAATASPPVYR